MTFPLMNRRASVLLAFVLLCINAFGQIQDFIPNRPSPPQLFNNLSEQMPNFLSNGEATQLEKDLRAFARNTSNQIVVVIVDDLQEIPPADFATELGQKWGVGQADKDNGIVLLICPVGGKNQRKVHIATGYGLEGAIPDAVCKQIVENEILPYFKEENYFRGIQNAVQILEDLSKGEYNSQEYFQKLQKQRRTRKIIVGSIIAVIAILLYIFRNKRGGGMTLSSGGFYFGGFGGGFGGGSGSGGFGGGGFGGFGGGGFGGGGAGGSW